MLLDKSAKYTLGNNWILRADPYCTSKEYSIYNINTRLTLSITRACYTFLNIFKRQSISLHEISKVFKEKNIKFDWNGFWNLCDQIVPFDLLIKSQKPLQPQELPNRSNKTTIYSDIPFASAPYDIEMHLTHRCNLQCIHCFQESSPSSNKFKELSEEEWINIFDKLEKEQVRSITLSGGEPLFYPHFTNLFNKIVNKRLNYNILTNGVLVNSNNINSLSRDNVFLSISLDGYSQNLHDKIRGKGMYDRVINNINQLVSNGAKISLSYTINSYNYLYIREMIELACKLKVKGLSFIFIDRIGRAKENIELALSPSQREQSKQIYLQLEKKYNKLIELNLLDSTSFTSFNFIPNKIYCSAGNIRAAISADGKVYPCIYAFGHQELIIGDLTAQNLQEIWNDDQKWRLFRGGIQLSQIRVCNSCSLNSICALKNCRLRCYDNLNGLYNKPIECMKDFS